MGCGPTTFSIVEKVCAAAKVTFACCVGMGGGAALLLLFIFVSNIYPPAPLPKAMQAWSY